MRKLEKKHDFDLSKFIPHTNDTTDTWSGLENRLVTYTDDATLIASVYSPPIRPFIAESLNRDLAKIGA